LRQSNGIPVFTSIKTIEVPYQEFEIESIIEKINERKKSIGFTRTEIFDIKYKEMLKKHQRRSEKKQIIQSVSLP
jgi:hypothetical protein